MTKEDVDEAIKDFEDMKKGIFPWDCSELCDIAISALKGEAFNEKSYKDGFNDGYSQGKEKAETKAYFDGQAYGWEQGRKALIEDVKAEIEKHQFSREYCSEHNIDTAIDMGMVRIILDNIGKESEAKPMERSNKDIIKDMREIVKPFISDWLKRVNHEEMGDIDKAEFETEFEKVLTLAEKAETLSEILDKISAEIREDYDPTTEGRFADDTYDAFEQGKKYCLDIIEKYKGVSE